MPYRIPDLPTPSSHFAISIAANSAAPDEIPTSAPSHFAISLLAKFAKWMYIKRKEMPNSFGRLHICLTIAAQVKGLGGYFFTLYLSFLGKRAML